MRNRLLTGLGAVLLLASATLVLWQGSFDFGSFRPGDPEQTLVYFGISIVIFLLMMTLGFMLARVVFKLWIDRRSGRLGSRIRTKLVAGALLLSLMPVFFMVVFSYYVMNRTLQRWFMGPTEHVLEDFRGISSALERETRARALAEAQLIAVMPETLAQVENPRPATPWLDEFATRRGITAIRILPPESMQPVARFGKFPALEHPGPGSDLAPRTVAAAAPVLKTGAEVGSVVVVESVPMRPGQQAEIEEHTRTLQTLGEQQKFIRSRFVQVLTLIALFILFAATWLAQYLARQISTPISALLRAAEEVSKGNLRYRVEVKAIDELALLVADFNRMVGDLDANRTEIETRRRLMETILESIPTGVISVDSAGSIQLVNKALREMAPSAASSGIRLDQIFSREDVAEIRYLMNRARRTGVASHQVETTWGGRVLHLAITVAAIDRGAASGFVIVLEDTSDLLQAQKTAAWSEVARRVAHEIKNPLTPIALSAERIVRQINRTPLPGAVDKVVRECAGTILDETASVKRLVDEFSQFARLPAAQPVLCDLNEVILAGVHVFDGRLEGIRLDLDLAAGLPPVMLDPEQFKRVVVNLIDNAAEAMFDSPVRALAVHTRAIAADTIEVSFADTGCGVTPDQKEKLFLPYFSTKGRGTGLGLAIVSHILTEHRATIRVEENKPSGARFLIEITAANAGETMPAETPATVNA